MSLVDFAGRRQAVLWQGTAWPTPGWPNLGWQSLAASAKQWHLFGTTGVIRLRCIIGMEIRARRGIRFAVAGF
jgi:hypothetical protein